MFRISHYMKVLRDQSELGPLRKQPGPVVIWNLIRRCNLTCKHCYSISADTDFKGELSTEEVYTVMDDLKQFRVPVLILSGGEPLLRPDIFDIGKRAKEMGFYVGLSSNGTLINRDNIRDIAAVGFDYVGVSIDGLKQNHDEFRQMQGGFEAALNGISLCREHDIKVGLRFTLTQQNAPDLPALLEIMKQHEIEKFYLSHLNYSGRGKRNRKNDAYFKTTRDAMDLLFSTAWEDAQAGLNTEYVTGNNDADGVYLLHWAQQHMPERVELLKQYLQRWGGNSSGINISNIDNLGNVHPDTFWWNYDLGNVREQPFSKIWGETKDEFMLGLRQSPRAVKGRCAECQYLNICGGNTRARAYSFDGDFWGEDPGCYLNNAEIGIDDGDTEADIEAVNTSLLQTPVNKFEAKVNS